MQLFCYTNQLPPNWVIKYQWTFQHHAQSGRLEYQCRLNDKEPETIGVKVFREILRHLITRLVKRTVMFIEQLYIFASTVSFIILLLHTGFPFCIHCSVYLAQILYFAKYSFIIFCDGGYL